MASDYFAQLEQKYGLPVGYLARTRHIESRGNDNAVSPTGATGPFQFTKGTARAMGLPLDQRTNLHASADAAARLAVANRPFLQKALGRDPTGGELYIAHQQGGQGGANLLANMHRPAGSLTNPMHISVNNGDPNKPASELVNQFLAKYDKAGAPSEGPGIGPTKEAAAMAPQQPFMAGGTPAAAVDPTKGKFLGSDAAIRPGGGIIGALNGPGDASMASKLSTFMASDAGTASMAGAGKGLGMLAQGLGAGEKPKHVEIAPVYTEENKADLSLLAMLDPKRKKLQGII